jgi:hypothetical protein
VQKEKDMTYKRGINSKHTSREFLKRGFKSMFPKYEKAEQAAPPVDTEPDGEKRPPRNG